MNTATTVSSNQNLEKALQTFDVYFKNPVNIIRPFQTNLKAKRKVDFIKKKRLNRLDYIRAKQIMTYQQRISQSMISLSQFGCGSSIMRGMVQLLKYLYFNGDYTKLNTEFFDQYLPHLQNPKASNTLRIASCYITSKIFKYLWARCHSPPTKELFEAYFKIAKNSEKFTKETAYKAIKDLIKSNPSNFFQISTEVYKNLQKAIQAEKVNEVKAICVKCLRVFVQGTLNYSSMHQYFEQILALTLKGFEESHQSIIEEYIMTQYCLFNMRLQETQQQGDLKSSFRIYNQQMRDAISAQPKKKQQTQTYLDVPRSLPDIVSFLSAIMLRIQTTNVNSPLVTDNIRFAMSQVITRLVETNRLHSEANEIETIITPLLLSIPQKSSYASSFNQDLELYKQKETVSWILSQLVLFMESATAQSQRSLLLKHCLTCLGQRQLLMNKETLETFAIFTGGSKGQKMVSTMMNEGQIELLKISIQLSQGQVIVLLRCINDILYQSESSFIRQNLSTEKEIIDPVIQYIRGDQSVICRLYAVEVIKTLGYKAPQWFNELVSIFLSFTTITNADITAIKQVPYLSLQDKFQGKQDAQQLQDNLQNLNFQALALSSLLTSVTQSLKGVPLSLMNSTFNAAKGMILGTWTVDEDEEELISSMDLNNIDLQESQRREAGWIILEGMIHLGNQWVGSRISLLYKLFNTVFTRDMCIVNPIQLKDINYQEKVLNEFKIKKQALSTIKCFLNKCFVLLNNQLLKLISQFVCNAVSFFFNQDKEKKEVTKLFKLFYPKELMQIKSDLFECLLLIPSHLYSSKFVHLLHSVCEEIVSDDISRTPSLFKKHIHFEDLCIGKEGKETYKFLSQKRSKFNKIYDADDSFSQEQFLPLLRLEQPVTCLEFQKHLDISDSLVSNAIQLFADIFSTQQLNIKNKQQLIKHFIVHTSPPSDKTQTPSASSKKGQVSQPVVNELQRSKKIIAISLATLLVAKNMAKKNELLDPDMYNQLKLIFKNCDLIQNNILLRIQSEGLIFLHIPHIIKEPQKQLDLFFKEIEISLQQSQAQQIAQPTGTNQSLTHNEDWLKKARHAAMIGNLVRYLDFESFLSHPSIIDRIIKIFTLLSKDNNNVVREFFVHYSYVICKRIGPECPQFFQQIFPSAFHQMQTDIKTDYLVLNSLGRTVEVQLRQNMGLVNDSRRAQIVLKEFSDTLFLGKHQKNKSNMLTSCDMIKSILILDPDQLEGKQVQYITRVIELIKQHSNLNIHIKCKLFELLSTFLYKGYFNMLKENTLKIDFVKFIIDELNQAYSFSQSTLQDTKLKKKFQVKMKKILSKNEEFEKLINFRQCYNYQNEKIFAQVPDKGQIKPFMYQYVIESLFMFVMKIGANIDISEWIELNKFIINYKQTSALQQFEEQKKGPGQDKQSDIMVEEAKAQKQYNFQYDLREQTRTLIVRAFKNFIQLFASVDTHQPGDIRKYLSTLISLAFSIISNDSVPMKKAGFSLTVVLVKLFSRTIEKIGDDDDDPSNQLKVFMNNPLLLEQYEAQIYSIIRQNLIMGSSSSHSQGQSNQQQKGQVDPEIIIKNYKLIYHFLTIPICKDPVIIGKIIQMLMENMHKTLLYQSTNENMKYYERIVTQTHFKKLILLSKLLISCFENEKFKRIETNSKKLNEYQELGSSSKEQQFLQGRSGSGANKKQILNKFQKQDKERIIEAFNRVQLKTLVNHLIGGLQDALIVLTMPKGSIKSVKEFNFIKTGTRSAYNQETIEKSVQYFLKALTFIPDIEKQLKIPKQTSMKDGQQSILTGIMAFYLMKPIEVTSSNGTIQSKKIEGDKKSIESDTLPQQVFYHVKIKILFLGLLQKFMTGEKYKLLTQQELNEYCQILGYLSNMGITEINDGVLHIYQSLLNKNFFSLINQPSDKEIYIKDFINNALRILYQTHPELNKSNSNDFDQKQPHNNELQKQELLLLKTTLDTINLLFKYMVQGIDDRSWTSPNNMETLKKCIALSVIKPSLNLINISNESLIKFYTNNVLTQVNLLVGVKNKQVMNDQIEPLIVEFIRLLSEEISDLSKDKIGKVVQYYILILLSSISILNDKYNQEQVSQYLNQIVKVDKKIQTITLLKGLISQQQKDIGKFKFYGHQLIPECFSLSYDQLKDLKSEAKQEEAVILSESVVFLVFQYQNSLTEQDRLNTLDQYMALLFSIVQCKFLTSPQRNSFLEFIYRLLQIDAQAFKNYIMNNATQAEKTLTEKVIKELAQRMTSSGANSQQIDQKQASLGQKGTQQDTSGGQQPEAKKQGTIQLTMNFKKK